MRTVDRVALRAFVRKREQELCARGKLRRRWAALDRLALAPLPEWFTLEDARAATGLARSTLERTLTILEGWGVIERQQGGGRGRRSLFRFREYEHWTLWQQKLSKNNSNDLKKRLAAPEFASKRGFRPRTCPRVNRIPELIATQPHLKAHLDYLPVSGMPYWRDLATLFRHCYRYCLRNELEDPALNTCATVWTSVTMHHIRCCKLTVEEALALWQGLRQRLAKGLPRSQRQLLHLLYIMTCALRKRAARIQTFEPLYERYHRRLPAGPIRLTQPRRVKHDAEPRLVSSPDVEAALQWVYAWQRQTVVNCQTNEPGATGEFGESRKGAGTRLREAWEKRVQELNAMLDNGFYGTGWK